MKCISFVFENSYKMQWCRFCLTHSRIHIVSVSVNLFINFIFINYSNLWKKWIKNAMLAPNKQSSLIAMEEERTLNCGWDRTHAVYSFCLCISIFCVSHEYAVVAVHVCQSRVAVCSNHTRKRFAVYNVDVLRQCALTHDTMDLYSAQSYVSRAFSRKFTMKHASFTFLRISSRRTQSNRQCECGG